MRRSSLWNPDPTSVASAHTLAAIPGVSVGVVGGVSDAVAKVPGGERSWWLPAWLIVSDPRFGLETFVPRDSAGAAGTGAGSGCSDAAVGGAGSTRVVPWPFQGRELREVPTGVRSPRSSTGGRRWTRLAWACWCELVGSEWGRPLHPIAVASQACAGSRYARSSLLDRRLWMRAGSGVDPLVRLAGRVRADLSLSTRQPWHREACGRGLDTLLPRYSTRELVCDLVREWVRWWGWRVGFEWSRPLYLTKGRREACAGSRYARSSLLDRRVFGVSEVGAWGAPVELSDGGASMLVRVAVLLRSAVCLGMARDLDLSVLARGPIPH